MDFKVRFYGSLCIRLLLIVFVSQELLWRLGISTANRITITVILCILATCIHYRDSFRPISKYFDLVQKTSHEYHLEKRALPSIQLFASRSPVAAVIVLSKDLLGNALPNALGALPPGSFVVVITHLISPKAASKRINADEISYIAKPGFSRAEAGICAYAAASLRLLKTRTWTKPNLGSRKWWKIKWVKQ